LHADGPGADEAVLRSRLAERVMADLLGAAGYSPTSTEPSREIVRGSTFRTSSFGPSFV